MDILPDLFDMYSVGYCQGGQGWQPIRYDYGYDHLVGYTVPPFVLGLVLLVLFGGGSFFAWFPQGGLVGDDFDTLSWIGKVKDYLWHMALPITASVAGNLAVMTVLTKNVFLEESAVNMFIPREPRACLRNRFCGSIFSATP